MGTIHSEYNLNSRNQERLHDISIDSVSGIQTFIDNASKSSNLTIVAAKFNEVETTEPEIQIIDNMPSVEIQSILKQETPFEEEKNKINNSINNLNEKQVKIVGAAFLGVVLIIILVAIFA